MKVPPLIASIVLAAIVGLQTWTLKEVVALKVQVAVLADRAHANIAKN